jgi:transmembrane 9 superfamily protein 2/4
MVYEQIKNKQEVEPGDILFTYDVLWRASNVRWASRWDIYLTMDNAVPDKVHWFSIVNSMLIVLFLSVMIAMILVRNLHRDISRYNRVMTEAEKEEEREESGWKLVHADVFRPPTTLPMLYCVFIGTGVQIAAMALITVFFAALGFLSPANRGSLMMATVVLYVLMGCPAGYTSARLYKTFKGRMWQRATLLTAFLFPGTAFMGFFAFDMILLSMGSTGAVPFTSMLALLALWFCVSVPLVFIGAYFGYKQEPYAYPVVTSNIPRTIPAQPWYLSPYFTVLVGGVLPFGACFVELFFILSSMWMNQYYYVFGFTALVYLILIITCAEITIVLCYFQLCAENYQWWWRSFLASGSTALYVFLYSAVYFTRLEANVAVTYLLYFGYMGLLCFAGFLMCGVFGFSATYWFVTKIYSSIKVD